MSQNAATNPEDFLPLTPAELHILLALAERPQHGYGIMQEVKLHTDGIVKLGPGTLYTSIKRMLDRGWIIETDPPDDSGQDDERRRYYELTVTGKLVASAEANRLDQVVSAARRAGLIGGTP